MSTVRVHFSDTNNIKDFIFFYNFITSWLIFLYVGIRFRYLGSGSDWKLIKIFYYVKFRVAFDMEI